MKYGQEFYEELLDCIMKVGLEKNYAHVSGARLGEIMRNNLTDIAYILADYVYTEAYSKELAKNTTYQKKQVDIIFQGLGIPNPLGGGKK